MGITFFNQWKSTRTEFSLIVFEYKRDFDTIDEEVVNLLIVGLMGFGMVIAIHIK